MQILVGLGPLARLLLVKYQHCMQCADDGEQRC